MSISASRGFGVKTSGGISSTGAFTFSPLALEGVLSMQLFRSGISSSFSGWSSCSVASGKYASNGLSFQDKQFFVLNIRRAIVPPYEKTTEVLAQENRCLTLPRC